MYSTKILNGVPSRCLAYGNHEGNPKYMVIVVPGNPGVVEYYRDFMEEVYRLLQEKYPGEDDVPVVGISHGGHQIDDEIDSTSFPSVDAHPKLYDLDGQTAGKLEFIESVMGKETKIILIGHSIGCKMLMEVLKSIPEHVQSRVIKCYMLFPTVERMKQTPNGKRLWPVLPYADYMNYLLWPLRVLPTFIQRYLVLLYFFFKPPTPCCVDASLQLFHGDVYRRIIALVRAELTTVVDLDVETLKIYGQKIFFYFGTKDGWCPLEYAHGMRERVPHLEYEICSLGLEHAFVVHGSKEMASVLVPRMLQDLKASSQ